MERAIFITKAGQLKYWDAKYSRLYYGCEFCERLIPSAGDLKKVISFIRCRRLDFTLVTPYVTNTGLEKVKLLLKTLSSNKISCEIVFNDWGVFHLLKHTHKNLSPVLGRLLTKQKRGPDLASLLERKRQLYFIKDPKNPKIKHLVIQKNLPLALDPYYKGSNASSVPCIHGYLSANGIQRIELDNTGQGLFLELPKGEVAASVYLPFVYISTTFFCLTAGCERQNASTLKYKPCKRECQKYVFRLWHKSLRRVMLLKGNTHFYKNGRINIRQWADMGVDRIVYQPEIPV